MLHENPFALAERDAEKAGACPVTLLDDFYASHWDFDSLCDGFSCRECVAAPEDMGFGGSREGDEPASRFEIEKDWEIPF